MLVLYSSWLLNKTDMMSSSLFIYSRTRHRYFCILYIIFSWTLSVFASAQNNGKLKMLSDNVEHAVGVTGVCSFSTPA
jgi:hypothetical protein